jgi:hypothetical protein
LISSHLATMSKNHIQKKREKIKILILNLFSPAFSLFRALVTQGQVESTQYCPAGPAAQAGPSTAATACLTVLAGHAAVFAAYPDLIKKAY